MCKRTTFIIFSVVAAVALAAGVGVLIWWLVAARGGFTISELGGNGFENVVHTAAVTRIRGAGGMFWWFYPSEAAAATARPLVLWLDGLTGLPPSLLANFGMFGPLDFNLNRRNNSWIDEYNLLFVDAPLGTGFSTANRDRRLSKNLDESTQHLLYTLESFYILHEEYQDTPLYIMGQGHGARLGLSLAIRLNEIDHFSHNLQGIVLGNGIVAPSLALTKLGFYLEELGYIDANGRAVIEEFSIESNDLMSERRLADAFDHYLTLGDIVNEEAGAVAVNLGYIVEKLTRETSERDYFGQKQHLRDVLRTEVDFNRFMEGTVAPALGLSGVTYDSRRAAALQAFRDSFMIPAIDKVEYILNNTTISVAIYNGNLDAVSNTPGQLEWVDNLEWSGQEDFRSSSRQTLVVNGLVEGYFRETERLTFYWMNAAGQSVPLDSPTAMRRVLQRITSD